MKLIQSSHIRQVAVASAKPLQTQLLVAACIKSPFQVDSEGAELRSKARSGL